MPAPLGQHSSEVDSMSEVMPRQVLTAQLIVDKHLCNGSSKCHIQSTYRYMASSRGHAEGQVYAITRNFEHYKNVER